MKNLIIAAGPQGSGNHLYAKLFGSNPKVFAWENLQDKYWEGHDMEPFADCWENPKLLLDFDISEYDYYYTSMGCPYVFDGETRIPNFAEFHNYAIKKFDNIQPGDVKNTYADTALLEFLSGSKIYTPLHYGINRFISWYKEYFRISAK